MKRAFLFIFLIVSAFYAGFIQNYNQHSEEKSTTPEKPTNEPIEEMLDETPTNPEIILPAEKEQPTTNNVIVPDPILSPDPVPTFNSNNTNPYEDFKDRQAEDCQRRMQEYTNCIEDFNRDMDRYLDCQEVNDNAKERYTQDMESYTRCMDNYQRDLDNYYVCLEHASGSSIYSPCSKPSTMFCHKPMNPYSQYCQKPVNLCTKPICY